MKIDMKNRRAALTLLATAALAGGVLGGVAPATAAGTHGVAVQANPGGNGLESQLSCSDPVNNGTDYNSTLAMGSTGAVTFPDVPDGYTCSASVYDDNFFPQYNYTSSASTAATTITVNGTARTNFRCTDFATINNPLNVTSTVNVSLPPTAGGSFDPSSVQYYWSRIDYIGGQPRYVTIQGGSGAHNSASYTLTEADYGHQIAVYIYGDDTTGNNSAYCNSAVSAPVGRFGTPAPRRPAIRGKAIVGHRLAARSSTAPAGSTVSGYQWYYERIVKKAHHHAKVVFVKIRGAKHSVYRLKKHDKGKLVVVGITYTRPSFNPTVLISKAKRVH